MIRTRKTFTGCKDLPLYNFIQVLVNEDMDYLYSERGTWFNRNGDLMPLWETIYNEYLLLLGNKKNSFLLSLLKQITFLNNRIELIARICTALSGYYDTELCSLLKRMGFNFPFTPETLEKDIKKTLIGAKSIILKRNETQGELEALQADEDSGEVTEMDFYALVAQISKYMQISIDPKNTTVALFMAYVKQAKSDTR